MARFFLQIAYDGTTYHGWQIQDNAHTVQAELNNAIHTITGNKNIETTGCGRTDTGVHAKQFFLHFDIDELPMPEKDLVHKLNRLLSSGIAVISLKKTNDDAHARFDAVSRTYEYFIHHQKNPFLLNRSWFYYASLDYDLMNHAAQSLLNFDDFASFCKAGASSKTTLCKVSEAYWEKTEAGWKFTITADRFLRNMVRAIVGTMIEVGKGSATVEDFIQSIEKKSRTAAGESVPACGLYLVNIKYPYPVM